MFKPTLKASVFTVFLLMQLCLGDTLKAAPGQFVGGAIELGGDFGSDLFIDAPVAIRDWMLDPMTSSSRKPITLKVNARIGWQLSVSSDRADGRMAQYDVANSSYIPEGRRLENSLKVSALGAEDHPNSWKADLPAGGTIQEGEETAGESRDVKVTLEQPVSWKDEPLPEGQAYHAVLVFTISPAE